MSTPSSPTEYLIISRGEWDKDLSRDKIQETIDKFYVWIDQLVSEGKMKHGQRLRSTGKTVGRNNKILDGPFGESKEAIGGYWFAYANSIDEAVELAKGNPCIELGLFVEVRPIDPEPASPENTRSPAPGSASRNSR
jgi:hypothetical protein